MSPRQVMALPFGGGLDRATGDGLIEPTQYSDLRNVVLHRGKAAARRGFVESATLVNVATTPMDDVLRLVGFKYALETIAAAWVRATRNVYLFKANVLGASAVVLDTSDADSLWFQAEAAVGTPIVSFAESYAKLFFAHDYHPYKPASTLLRGPTWYYDPTAAAGSRLLAFPSTDLGGGTEVPRFAGVTTYLAYLIGWGYGNKTTPDRPEVLRISEPAEPLTFIAGRNFVVGNRGDPIVTCRAARSIPNASLLIFKESETYELFGYDRASFGVRLVDPLFGCAGPMLAVTYNNSVFYWSLQGPRVFDAGTSADLSVPLDLNAPEPADLAASGDARRGWAEYDPDTRSIMFAFPNDALTITRVYRLHLRYPNEPRWSYDVFGKELFCATVFLTARGSAVPTGYPDCDTATPASTYATLPWHNDGNRGDEMIETWLQPAAGAWYKASSVAAGAPSASGSVVVSSLTDGTVYARALRYELNGQYNVGAESAADPSLWPAASRDTFTTAATGGPPTGFADDGQSAPYEYGHKYYADQAFVWDAAPGDPWELWVAIGSSDIADAGLYLTGASGHHTTDTRLVNATQYYYWLRYSIPESSFTTPALGPITYSGA